MQLKAPPENYGGRSIGNLPEVIQIFKEIGGLEALTKDFFKSIAVLQKDGQLSITYFNRGSHTEFWKRVYIKTMFAWIEGQAFALKRMALERSKIFDVGFTIAELAMLREDKYTLKDNGDVTSNQTGYLKLFPNLKFAYKSFAKAHGQKFELDSKGFADFSTVEKVRHRLTHPKGADDLVVSDDELQLAVKVFQWFIDESGRVFVLATMPANLTVLHTPSQSIIEHTLPWVISLPDGNTFEFRTKRNAKEFATANGATVERRDFFLFNFNKRNTGARLNQNAS